MVRFIIQLSTSFLCHTINIYIPIWLDLLSKEYINQRTTWFDLHSNMVRFIISQKAAYRINRGIIYIPIWLDLLSVAVNVFPLSVDLFTFQYG